MSRYWPRWLRPNRRWPLALPLAAIALGGGIGSYFQWLIVVQAADGHGTYPYFVASLADMTLWAASYNAIDSITHGDKWKQWPWLSVFSFAVALTATIYANIMSEHPLLVPSWEVRVWPAVAFLMAMESLMSFIRRERRRAAESAWRETEATGSQTPREWLDAQLRTFAEARSDRAAAEEFGVSRTRVAAAKATLNGQAAAHG